MVYEYIFDYATYTLELAKHEGHLQATARSPDIDVHHVGRQIYAESSLLLYSRTTFGFKSCSCLQSFIYGRTTEQLQVITSLRFHTWVGRYFYHGEKHFRNLDWSTIPLLHSLSKVEFLDITMPYQRTLQIKDVGEDRVCTLDSYRQSAGAGLRSRV
jgi:hypothetical protein